MKITLFDTETTGLLLSRAAGAHKQPKVIEFFALPLEIRGEGKGEWDWVEGEPLHLLFNPGEKLDPKITRITGIRDRDLADKLPFLDHAGAVRVCLQGADMVVAHNLSFDKGIIDAAYARENLQPVQWPRGLCTVEATEHIYGTRMSLSNIYQELFNDTFAAHRAEDDVRAMGRVFRKLVEDGEIVL